ncbi:MAG: phosphoglycerate mutase family protein [Ilumatobacteraceae bacterium]
MVFLVRHAKAGHRNDDHPDDSLRPLTESGWDQSRAIVDTLIAAGATGPLFASPFTRCQQTLQPLGQQLDLPVTPDHRLAEAQPFLPVLEMIADLPDGAVLCSHGDLIPDVIDALHRRGCRIITEPNWKKASVWSLGRDDDGRVTTASAWPPPAN